MAIIAPPKKSKAVTRATKAKPAATSAKATIQKSKSKAAIEQAAPDVIVPLQLKVPKAVKAEYKAYSALREKTMSELFEEMFDQYKENND